MCVIDKRGKVITCDQMPCGDIKCALSLNDINRDLSFVLLFTS